MYGTIIAIEIQRIIRKRSYLYFLLILAFIAYLSVPSAYEHYSVFLLNGKTGLPNAYWLETIPLVITNMLYLFFSFFFFRGNLMRDRASGLLQEVYTSGASTKAYLIYRYVAVFLVQLLATIAISLGIVALFMTKVPGLCFDTVYYLKMLAYFQLPTYVILSALFLYFEMQSLFRTKMGDVIYFILAWIIFGMTLSNGYLDMTGMVDVTQSVKFQLGIKSSGLQIFTNSSRIGTFEYLGLHITYGMWLRKLGLCCLSLLSYGWMVILYVKRDFYSLEAFDEVAEEIQNKISVQSTRTSTNHHKLSDINISTTFYGFVWVIWLEIQQISRNHKVLVCLYVVLISFGLMLSQSSIALLFAKVAFVLLLPILNEIGTRACNPMQSNAVKVTYHGFRLQLLQSLLMAVFLLPVALIMVLGNQHLVGVEKLYYGAVGIVALHVILQVAIKVVPRSFDLIYLCIWMISIVYNVPGVDWFMVHTMTEPLVQMKQSLQTIIVLSAVSVVIKYANPSKLFKFR